MSEYGRAVAVVLAAGSGKRMGSAVPKQFLMLAGEPVLYWTLKAFEESVVDAVVLVVADSAAIQQCRDEIVVKNRFNKVKSIVTGGRERYESVLCGLRGIDTEVVGGADYVLIHDGARCLVTPELIGRTLLDASRYQASVAAMPVKDTIKLADEEDFAVSTPDRRFLRQMQTPQTFSFPIIMEAYEKMMREEPVPPVTDDAMVLERESERRVHFCEGSYENLKITTPEDLILAEAILKKRLT